MKQLELIRQKLVPTQDSALTAVPNPHLLKELWGWDGLYQGKRDIFLNPTLTSRLPLGEGSEVRHMETLVGKNARTSGSLSPLGEEHTVTMAAPWAGL